MPGSDCYKLTLASNALEDVCLTESPRTAASAKTSARRSREHQYPQYQILGFLTQVVSIIGNLEGTDFELPNENMRKTLTRLVLELRP